MAHAPVVTLLRSDPHVHARAAPTFEVDEIADQIKPSSRLAARKKSVVNVAGRYEKEFKNDPGVLARRF